MLYHNKKIDIIYSDDVLKVTFDFAKHTLFVISHAITTNPKNQNLHNLTSENFKKITNLLKVFLDFYYPISKLSIQQYKKEFYTIPIEYRKQYLLGIIKNLQDNIEEIEKKLKI